MSEEVETNAQGEASYDYTVPSTGNIYIKAILHEDGKEVVNRGGSFWASDRRGEEENFSFRDYGQSSIRLIPDKNLTGRGKRLIFLQCFLWTKCICW